MRLLREDWMPQLWAHPFLSLGKRSSESRAMSDSLTDCKGRCPGGTAEGWGLQTAPFLVGLQGQGLLHPLICFGPCPASQHSSPATSGHSPLTPHPGYPLSLPSCTVMLAAGVNTLNAEWSPASCWERRETPAQAHQSNSLALFSGTDPGAKRPAVKAKHEAVTLGGTTLGSSAQITLPHDALRRRKRDEVQHQPTDRLLLSGLPNPCSSIICLSISCLNLKECTAWTKNKWPDLQQHHKNNSLSHVFSQGFPLAMEPTLCRANSAPAPHCPGTVRCSPGLTCRKHFLGGLWRP